MRSEVPAAVPLIAYAAGLACGHLYGEAIGFAVIAILLMAMRRARLAFAIAALAGGVFASAHQQAARKANDAALKDRKSVV